MLFIESVRMQKYDSLAASAWVSAARSWVMR